MDAEALHSAGSTAEYEQLWTERRDAYECLTTDDGHWQLRTTRSAHRLGPGGHRAVGTADLVTAVLAAEHRMAVVHYDPDFEMAAEVVE